MDKELFLEWLGGCEADYEILFEDDTGNVRVTFGGIYEKA